MFVIADDCVRLRSEPTPVLLIKIELFDVASVCAALGARATPVPPEAYVRHVAHVMLPAASSAIGPLAETAIVPEAFGKVNVLFAPLGAAKTRELVVAPAVSVRVVTAPCRVRFCDCEPTVNAPDGVRDVSVPPISPVPLKIKLFIVSADVDA